LEQGTEGYVLKEFLRLGKQLLIQELLETSWAGTTMREQKVDFKGYRNGYEPRRLKDIEPDFESFKMELL